jgi:hypothetical protein
VPATAPDGLYYLVIAAASEAALPARAPLVSLFTDRDDTELKRVDATSREVLRQDALIKERDLALDRQTFHIRHLEELVAYRERIVVERDAQLAELNAARESQEQALLASQSVQARANDTLARCESELAAVRKNLVAMQAERRNLDAALAAQERIISDRQSLRWWLRMPCLRVKLWWNRIRGA